MSNKFSLDIQRAKKTNNHKIGKSAKIILREQVLSDVGENNAAVFDAFAGAGMMYRHVWNKAAHYVGCDLKWYPDERVAYVADNRRVLRAIDLSPFNIFDLDTYGSPWGHLIILADRSPVTADRPWWACLTVGEIQDLKLGGMPHALRQLLGITRPPAGGARVNYIPEALAAIAKKMNATVAQHLNATVAGKITVEYHAALFVAKSP